MHNRAEWRWALACAAGLLALFYLQVLLGLVDPMYLKPGAWGLQDPVVSGTHIVPAFRTWRFELLEHGQMMWSALRGNGVPILSFDIQNAPLFPLTWLLAWVPEPAYWSVLVCVRQFLIALLAFFVGRRLLQLSREGAVFFTLFFAFSVYVLRWHNHPWENGLLAALLYALAWDFLWKACVAKRSLRGPLLLLVLACYALCTCGFPESAALNGLMLFWLLLPRVLDVWRERQAALRFVGVAAFAHVAAFLLAAPQFFAIFEMMREAGQGFSRHHAALQQITSLPHTLLHVLRMSDGYPPTPVVWYSQLIPLALLPLALPSLRRATLAQTGVLLCALYALLKFLPVWPAFNAIWTRLPIFMDSWMLLYGFCAAILPFAYLAARGAERWLVTPARARRLSLLLPVCALALAAWAAHRYAAPVAWQRGGIAILFVLFALWSWRGKSRKLPWIPLLLLCALEMRVPQPSSLLPRSHALYGILDGKRTAALDWASQWQQQGYSLSGLRGRNPNGEYVAPGLASADTGASALLTERMRWLRSLWDLNPKNSVYMPVPDGSPASAWRFSSANWLSEEQYTQGRQQKPLLDPLAWPRAFVSHDVQSVKHPEEGAQLARKKLQTGERGFVLLEGDAPRLPTARYRPVDVQSDQGSRLQLSESQGPGWLVLHDTYFPGWTAHDTLSGQELPVYPANIAFRAVPLTEARPYKIEFRYTPPWLRQGLICVALGLLLLLGPIGHKFFARLLRNLHR